jgi:hypothetical protein
MRAIEKTSEYYGVCFSPSKKGGKGSTKRYVAAHKFLAFITRNGKTVMRKRFETEREAAIAVDKQLIAMGEEPRNILKKK